MVCLCVYINITQFPRVLILDFKAEALNWYRKTVVIFVKKKLNLSVIRINGQ